MSLPTESREEAIERLNRQAEALKARAAPEPVAHAHGEQAAAYGYRLLADLIGGVLVGLALGWGFDMVVGSLPWGVIAGTLLGFAVSIRMAVRSAKRLSDRALKEFGPPRDLPEEPEDIDEIDRPA